MIIVVLAALLVVAVALAGCGGKSDSSGKSSDGKLTAKSILEKSSQKMQDVKSVKSAGTYKINAPAAGMDNLNVTFEMEIQMNGPDDTSGRIVMSGLGAGDTLVYLDKGWVYTEVPGQGWVKQPMSSSTGVSGAPTPQDIKKFADASENMVIMSEDGDSWTISFDVGPKYLEEAMKSTPGTEGLTPELQDMMNSLVKSMKINAIFKVNKSTFLVDNATVKMNMQGGQGIGDMAFDIVMAFRDYNQPVNVALPQEAANAQEMSSSPGGLFPGFPGGESVPNL